MFLISILIILTKKYIEEKESLFSVGFSPNNGDDPAKVCLDISSETISIDVEQNLFNINTNLIFKSSITTENQLLYVYYCSTLLSFLIPYTMEFDYYLNIEKYIKRLQTCYLCIEEGAVERLLFRKLLLELMGNCFDRTKAIILEKPLPSFTISIIFSEIIIHKDELYTNKDNIFSQICNKREGSSLELIKTKSEYKETESEIYSNVCNDFECFYKYMYKFTTDVTTGKKTFTTVEEHLNNGCNGDLKKSSAIFDILIIYIFNKCRNNQQNFLKFNSKTKSNIKEHRKSDANNLNMISVTNRTLNYNMGKIILSSIFEFLCDKINYSENLVIQNFN